MIVMDGSMGNELLARRSDLVTGLWSAQYLIDAPELVKEIHLDYINAGADLIITNTYSTIPSYLSKQKAEDKMTELIHLAGKLASRKRLQKKSYGCWIFAAARRKLSP
jgi:S-methylmethionine-dependent homocysteine/selenocysteine methylase